jgi:hypothetical protein
LTKKERIPRLELEMGVAQLGRLWSVENPYNEVYLEIRRV